MPWLSKKFYEKNMWYTKIEGEYTINGKKENFKIDEKSEKANNMLEALFEMLMSEKEEVEICIASEIEYFKKEI